METQELAEKLLSETWECAVKLENGKSLGGSNRSHVLRYTVSAASSHVPETVVIKHAIAHGGETYDPDSAEGPAVRTFNDWAGLQFLSECFGGTAGLPVPRFIAGDRAAGLIAMHDLGEGKGLDHYLLGDDPIAAEECMTALFSTLGRVHAVTCGKQTRYDEIRDALGPRKADPLEGHIKWHQENPPKGLALLGVEPMPGLLDEIAEFVTAFRGDGPFRVYSHNDPCPDNVLWIDGRMTLLDFEFSGMANAAVDMRYPRAIWPTCWCANRTPDPIVERLTAAYRAELVKGCPEAADDRLFYQQMAAGCADAAMGMLGQGWLEWSMSKGARLGDFRPAQQILSRLDGFAQVSEEHNQFPIVGRAARNAASAIRSRLPSDFREMPIYMAFRNL